MVHQSEQVGSQARALSGFTISEVEVSDVSLTIRMNAGGAVEWPLRRLPEVARAQPDARRRWELTSDGAGINWPELSAPQPTGLLAVWEILEERLYDEALGRGAKAGWKLERLSRPDAELVALWRVRMDLVLGSYLQFRYSWDAATCSLARAALARVGAPGLAWLLEQMDALADAHALPREVADHVHAPSRIPGSTNDQLQELEEAFWHQASDLSRLVVQTYGYTNRAGEARVRRSVRQAVPAA